MEKNCTSKFETTKKYTETKEEEERERERQLSKEARSQTLKKNTIQFN